MTSTLKVSRQCNEAALKGNRIRPMGMIYRQFNDLDKKSFLILYATKASLDDT